MNLIDRYVAEVGKHLPQNQRADIEREIRSTLLDMLEERDQASHENEAAVIALLKEYGAPRKVAESYVGPRYLIGPRIYPTFELVVKIVLAVLLGVGLLGFGISGVFNRTFAGPEFINLLGEFWSGLLGGMFSALGTIVVVFAILERVLPASEFEKEAEDWDPAELAKEPDSDEVKISDAIATIIFTMAGLVIFNLYPNLIGVGFVTDGEWTFVPALSDAFFNYLPWINLLGMLEIGFSLYQLRQRTWTTLSRLFKIGIEAGSLALAVAMLRGPSLVDLDTGKLAGTSLAEAVEVLTRVMDFVPAIVLIIIIVISGIEVAQMAYRLMKGRSSSPYPVEK
ncbi:MAG TPA: hypothetical protein VMJ90_03080 [Anaerolineales bacterium]|nr:hypothetical protein [Anaerolineales bacterium]